MKVNENFMLSVVAGKNVVMPIGDEADKFHGMLKLNETGAFLFKALENDTTEDALVAALCKEYEVGEDVARRDTAAFLSVLRSAGILEE